MMIYFIDYKEGLNDQIDQLEMNTFREKVGEIIPIRCGHNGVLSQREGKMLGVYIESKLNSSKL